jgi:ferric-dicitrate binding protein FerR (iron transport regulator)
MKLHDREILELNELCGAVVDGTLTEAQRGRLSQWLRGSEAARRYYVRAMGQSASLHGYAAEVHADAPDAPARWRRTFRYFWWANLLPLAAAVVFAFFWFKRGLENDGSSLRAIPSAQFVARVTGARNAQWAKSSLSIVPGTHLQRGQRVELTSGYAEITFDCGARVVLEGAASLEVSSAWDATLRHGTLKASVPPEAIGFRVSNAAVEVIDLGTEFTMIADGKGAAEVLVLKGEVEAAPRASLDETILLRENEARRFARSGISNVVDSERKFALFAQPLALDRFSPPINYVHWSFDEADGDAVRGETAGAGGVAMAPQLSVESVDHLPSVRTAGAFGKALRFDGQTQARGAFPGISNSAPRTVAFWVKVPEDAQLSDAYAMVAWATDLPKLGSRPVGISWNRRPAEGAIGALRTDFGGGHAMGTTSLRDGKWHHVAVYFAAGDDPAAPVQVKQYLDGRLESSTIVPNTIGPKLRGDGAVLDVVWLGYRLTGTKQRDRFRGEIDELFIADGALQPNEIVALMKDNRPASSVIAAAK